MCVGICYCVRSLELATPILQGRDYYILTFVGVKSRTCIPVSEWDLVLRCFVRKHPN